MFSTNLDPPRLPTGRPSGHQQTASGPEAPSVSSQPVPPAPARRPPASPRSAGLPAGPAAPPAGPAPPPTAAPPPAAAAQRSAAAPPAEPTQHTQPAHAALWNGRCPGQREGDEIVQISRLPGLDKDAFVQHTRADRHSSAHIAIMLRFCAAAEANGAAGERAADKEREGDGSVRPELLVLAGSRQTGNRAAAS